MRVSSEDVLTVPGARNAEANLLVKCKFCSSKAPAAVSFDLLPYGEALFSLECRGVEPMAVRFEEGLEVICESSGRVHSVDLQMGDEWCGYDDASGEGLALYSLSVSFKRQ